MTAKREFDFERLDIYRKSMDFISVADSVVKELPRGRHYLADQLQRASVSIALNIAEGAGEFASREKARFYRMARRSATESAAILDACSRLEVVDKSKKGKGRELLLDIVSMLVRMIRNLGDGGQGQGQGQGQGNDGAGQGKEDE